MFESPDPEAAELQLLPKAGSAVHAVRAAFDKGADRVVSTSAPLSAIDLREGLGQMVGAEAVAWLDPRPLGPSHPKVQDLLEPLRAPRVLAIGMWRHAFEALHDVGELRDPRALSVHLMVKARRAGLEVRTVKSEASPGWYGGQGVAILKGWVAAWFSKR